MKDKLKNKKDKKKYKIVKDIIQKIVSPLKLGSIRDYGRVHSLK